MSSSTNDIDESTRAFNAMSFSSPDVSLNALQMIKLDLCYANLKYIITKMLSFTRYVMSTLSHRQHFSLSAIMILFLRDIMAVQ
ncbi:unnamed protein product [Toxocara canis]|uniref:Uncharacterized protein n=1 Tax=Toxocara canis TaxID=6265 RepID=A0A183V2X8_TOXCA|nr:unnamed protein product [Toxocara canis]